MSTNYSVIIRPYAERHYVAEFEKKFKRAWDIILEAVMIMLQNIDTLLQTTKAEIIATQGANQIIKCEFAVAGRRESPHASGNRIIVLTNTETRTCEILLVYAKNHIGGGHETNWWKNTISTAYPDVYEILVRK